VEYFNYLGSTITSDARCTCEIKSSIAPAKAAFNRKKTLLTRKYDINLRKKLAKCCIWSISLYAADTWTLCKVYQKYLESFKYRAEEGWRRSVGPILWEMRNVTHSQGGEEYPTNSKKNER
jgi:hypothetical protein